jgi:hypothetical protein
VSTAFAYSNPLYLYVNAQCNQTWNNTTSLSTLSNLFAVWSNLQNTTTVNTFNYSYNVLTNYTILNVNYSSNSTVFASNTAVSASSVGIYCSNNFPTVSNNAFAFINSNSVRSTFGCNAATFASNQLSNYRLSSVAIDYSTLTNKPLFDNTNNTLSIGLAVIGSAGLTLAGYDLFNGLGMVLGVFRTVVNATTDLINLASCYSKFTNYVECGIATTRYADGVITMKSNTISNLVLTPWNLTTSCNGYFVPSSLTTSNNNVSITNNLNVGGTFSNVENASVGGLTCTGLSMNNPSTTNIVASTLFTPYLNSNNYMLNVFGQNTGVAYNAGFHGLYSHSNSSQSNYAAFGLWGYGIGYQTFKACRNGKFDICTTSPTATLDVNGTANVSSTPTSATHSNCGNLQSSYILSLTHSNTGNMSIGGTLSCANLTDQTRKVSNTSKLNVWRNGGTDYYLIVVSPNDSVGISAGGLRISGSAGGSFRHNLCQIDCTITNRGGVRYLGDAYGAISEAQKWCDIVVYNSNNVQWQYLLATYQLYLGFDLEISQGDVGLGTVLQEPTATPYYSNLVFNPSNTSLGSVLSNLNLRCETTTMTTTISSNMTVNGSFQRVSATISSNLNVGSNLSVSGTIYPTALSMSTNPLYIQIGNAGIIYANVSVHRTNNRWNCYIWVARWCTWIHSERVKLRHWKKWY